MRVLPFWLNNKTALPVQSCWGLSRQAVCCVFSFLVFFVTITSVRAIERLMVNMLVVVAGVLNMFVCLCCAVPAKPGQDEFINTQEHPGSSCSAETADGVQGSETGNTHAPWPSNPPPSSSIGSPPWWQFVSHSSLGVAPSSFQIQRLPFLPSSNLALDTLRGNDESIGFEDILNGESPPPPLPAICTNFWI